MRRTQATLPTLKSPGSRRSSTMSARPRRPGASHGLDRSGKPLPWRQWASINQSVPSRHIVTLKGESDRIPYTINKARTFIQRELGTIRDFASVLRSALRQAPNVPRLFRFRDRATVGIASRRRRRPLVMETRIRSIPGNTINRTYACSTCRTQGADSAPAHRDDRYISLSAWCRRSAGRRLVQEIMVSNLLVRELIALGESDFRQLLRIIEGAGHFVWTTCDQT